MSATGLDVFDKTLHITHIWLDELMAEIGPDRHLAWHVLGVVLRAVRDRIPLELAVHLGSQLPLLVRGAYYDRWHAPGRMEAKPRSVEEFLEPIRQEFAQLRPMKARGTTRAVFRILSRHVSPGQIDKVRNSLPGHIRALWPVAPDVRGLREGPERYGAGAFGGWKSGMARSRPSGFNIRVGTLVTAGLAVAALAALRSSGRWSSMAWGGGRSRAGDRSRFSSGRNEGRGHESRGPSGRDRNEVEGYGDQVRGRRGISSGYGGPEMTRDYRGGGYGSAYMPGGYDPDSDYRGHMTGSGGDRRSLRASQSDWGEGPASGRGYGATGFGQHRGRGPKSYARSDDRIREDVCDRLTDDPNIDASQIEVSVSNGEVTLSGRVGDRNAKRSAKELAERIGGVRRVQNNLRVNQGSTAVESGGAPGRMGPR
jgi:uncharacterized protein (DUF2267 family)/osmotically-inducible protein OsmY